MTKRSFQHILFLFPFLVAGCTKQPKAVPTADASKPAAAPVAYDSEWNNRNEDIYRYLLANLREPTADRIYFITTTPMSEWGDTGSWTTIPSDKLTSAPNASRYRAANGAYLKDGRVLEKGTDAEAWMQWISIKRWINDNEVEVEDGVWCCPLGGGASTTIYKKVDGKWQIKEQGESWVS
jgi:hypothetical protein